MNQRELGKNAARRLAILRHAREVTGNVAMTCRYYGISRQVFYTWLRCCDAEGPAGNGSLSGAVPAQVADGWICWCEEVVPGWLRRAVTSAGGQREHTMSYLASWAKRAVEVVLDEGSGPVSQR